MQSLDPSVLALVAEPFSLDGGLTLLDDNLGRAIIKVWAIKPEHRVVEAPAILLDDQNDLEAAYKQVRLNQSFIAIMMRRLPASQAAVLSKLSIGMTTSGAIHIVFVTCWRRLSNINKTRGK